MYRQQIVSGPSLQPTGNVTSGSAVVTGMSGTAGILVGSLVFASGYLPPDTLVASVDSASQVTLTLPAQISGSAVVLTVHNEPVTLAQAKAHARIEFSDDDPLVASLITSARKVVETMAGQRFIATTIDYFADNWPWIGGYYNRVMRAQAVMGPMPYWLPNSNSGILDLHDAPLLSVTWVKYQDFTGAWQTISPSDYIYDSITPGSSIVGPSRIQPQYAMTWPIPRPVMDCVNIRFVVGYGADYTAVPENLKTAIKFLIGYWYENREAIGQVGGKLELAVESLVGVSEHGSYG